MRDSEKFLQRAKSLAAQLSEEEKLGLLTTHHLPVERLGLSEFYIGTEVARGYVGRSADRPSTVFPQPIGLASTFDRDLMRRLGEIAGDEARAYYNCDKLGGLALWGPTVDMVRDPRWGRTEEAYGEDVFLAGELTAAYTLGMAGENDDGFYKTVPTLKHFCANNNEIDRVCCDAYLPPRLKYEYYYSSFENAIRYGGARSVMAAYNEINGLPAIMNPELKTILKEQWGLWFAVSDGGDFSQNVNSHHYCKNFSEAYQLSLRAGCDTMTDNESLVRAAAEKALADGLITWQDIDESVVNTLYARLRLGMLDQTEFDKIATDVIDSPKHREINAKAAREQFVLLKNDGVLPLAPCEKCGKIAVVGALADESLMDWYTGHAARRCTVLDGMRAVYGDVVHDSLWDIAAVKAPNGKYLCAYEDGTVRADADSPKDGALFEIQDWGENWINLFSCKFKRYVRLFEDGIKLHNREIYDWFTRETFNFKDYMGGTLIEEFLTHKRLTADDDGKLSVVKSSAAVDSLLWKIEIVSGGKERAERIAKECGTVIYCVGNYPVQTAKEGYDRKTLALNVQPGLTRTLEKINPRTVLLLISSYPYAVVDEGSAAGAVLWSSHAGAELGSAAADVLSGKYNPAGRLPLTWYRSEYDLPEIKDYDIESAGSTYMYFKGKPLYPFGYGLSYSKFEYSGLKISGSGENLFAETEVKNVSEIGGDEVVQVYFAVKNSEVSRPLKKLCGFERVHLEAGEKRAVKLKIPRHILRIYDVRAEKMIVERGVYTFAVGGSSADIRGWCEFAVEGEKLCSRPNSFKAENFDSAEGVRLKYSQKFGYDLLCADGWVGSMVYGGLCGVGGKTFCAQAGAMMNTGKLTVSCGEWSAETEIPVADSFDEPALCKIKLPENIGDELVVTINEGCFIGKIDIV